MGEIVFEETAYTTTDSEDNPIVVSALDSKVYRAIISLGTSTGTSNGSEQESKTTWTCHVSKISGSEFGSYTPYNVRVVGLTSEEDYQIKLFDKLYELEKIGGDVYLKGGSPDNQVAFSDKDNESGVKNFGQKGTANTAISEQVSCELQKKSNATKLVEKNAGLVKNTTWLVTHDPEWEKQWAQKYPKRCKQAALMNNVAKIAFTTKNGDESTCSVELWTGGFYGATKGTYVCKGNYVGVSNGMAVYEFRTNTGSAADGAKTDPEGNVYIEDVKLPEQPNNAKNYTIKVYHPQASLPFIKQPIKIGPMMRNLCTPKTNIFNGDALDPYSDNFDIVDDNPEMPDEDEQASEYNLGFGYGLEMRYDLITSVKAAIDTPKPSLKALIQWKISQKMNWRMVR